MGMAIGGEGGPFSTTKTQSKLDIEMIPQQILFVHRSLRCNGMIYYTTSAFFFACEVLLMRAILHPAHAAGKSSIFPSCMPTH
jgi:hypothetical protein